MHTGMQAIKRERDAEISLNAPIPKRNKLRRPKPPPPLTPPPPPPVLSIHSATKPIHSSLGNDCNSNDNNNDTPNNQSQSQSSPSKSIPSVWSPSSYGESPPRSRLEMKKMKKHLQKNEHPHPHSYTHQNPLDHDHEPGGSVSSNSTMSSSIFAHMKHPSSASNTANQIKSSPPPPKVVVNSQQQQMSKSESKRVPIKSEIKSDTRITIRRKIDRKISKPSHPSRSDAAVNVNADVNIDVNTNANAPSESSLTESKRKSKTEKDEDGSPNNKKNDSHAESTPAWLSAFMVGGNIAEKVKLSRRKASMKNLEKKDTTPTKQTSSARERQKSPVKSRSTSKSPSASKTATSASKAKSKSKSSASGKANPSTAKTLANGKKKPLRISLKMNASKKSKLLASSKNKSPSRTKPNSDISINRANGYGSKKRLPEVVQIRPKNKKRKKLAVKRASVSSSSESDSDSDTSSSGSESSSGSSDSDSDSASSSDSSGSSSSSESGSSSSDNSSGDSDSSSDSDSNSDDDDERRVRKRNAMKHIARKKTPVVKKTKTQTCLKGSRGKPVCGTAHKIREMEKDEIDNTKLPCDNVPKVRSLTQAEIRSILAADDASAGISTNWVRRSTRQPSRSAINSPNIRAIIGKLEMNDPDMVVLKCKKYLSDSDTPSVIVDAMLDALEKNTNCQALYIQNFNTGMRDEQVLHLLRILQLPTCKIWCLNIGETYNVKRRTWAQFTNGLKKTNITHMYASEHTISSAMKEKIRETIRKNRSKQTLHVDPNNLDVIVQCTHCWWNPINAKVLQPYVKQRGYEYLLFDKVAQGTKDVITDSSKI